MGHKTIGLAALLVSGCLGQGLPERRPAGVQGAGTPDDPLPVLVETLPWRGGQQPDLGAGRTPDDADVALLTDGDPTFQAEATADFFSGADVYVPWVDAEGGLALTVRPDLDGAGLDGAAAVLPAAVVLGTVTLFDAVMGTTITIALVATLQQNQGEIASMLDRLAAWIQATGAVVQQDASPLVAAQAARTGTATCPSLPQRGDVAYDGLQFTASVTVCAHGGSLVIGPDMLVWQQRWLAGASIRALSLTVVNVGSEPVAVSEDKFQNGSAFVSLPGSSYSVPVALTTDRLALNKLLFTARADRKLLLLQGL